MISMQKYKIMLQMQNKYHINASQMQQKIATNAIQNV